MSRIEGADKKYVRYHPRAFEALKVLIAQCGGPSGGLSFEGKPVTDEAFICASWLWMQSLGPRAVAEALAPHVARYDAMLDEAPFRAEMERRAREKADREASREAARRAKEAAEGGGVATSAAAADAI